MFNKCEYKIQKVPIDYNCLLYKSLQLKIMTVLITFGKLVGKALVVL